MDEQMAAWMEFASPAQEHEFLRKLEGTWKAKVTFWMQPDQPPHESTGTAKNEMILGGRFLRSKFDGPGMTGEPFEGFGLDGYDRLRRKHIGIWMDTMGTGWMVFEGTVEGDVRTMLSQFTDPSGKQNVMKGVTTVVSNKEHRYESYNQPEGGKFFKNMEIVFTR